VKVDFPDLFPEIKRPTANRAGKLRPAPIVNALAVVLMSARRGPDLILLRERAKADGTTVLPGVCHLLEAGHGVRDEAPTLLAVPGGRHEDLNALNLVPPPAVGLRVVVGVVAVA